MTLPRTIKQTAYERLAKCSQRTGITLVSSNPADQEAGVYLTQRLEFRYRDRQGATRTKAARMLDELFVQPLEELGLKVQWGTNKEGWPEVLGVYLMEDWEAALDAQDERESQRLVSAYAAKLPPPAQIRTPPAPTEPDYKAKAFGMVMLARQALEEDQRDRGHVYQRDRLAKLLRALQRIEES